MDPKVQKNLSDAIEELEEKLKPLQELSSLSDNLTKVGGDLSASAKTLEQSGKPFPEALEALKRASDSLSEVSILLKNADPKIVAERLSGMDSSLKSLNSDVHKAIEDQSSETREYFFGEITAKTDVVSQEIKGLAELMLSETRRARIFSMISGAVSFIVGAVIIGLLLANS